MNLQVQFSPAHIEAERAYGAVSQASRALADFDLHLHRNPGLEESLNTALDTELRRALAVASLAIEAVATGIFMASREEAL